MGFLLLSGLAAGAANLIPELVKRGMPPLDVPVNNLTLEQWAKIANVYDEWPFKSDVSLPSTSNLKCCCVLIQVCYPL